MNTEMLRADLPFLLAPLRRQDVVAVTLMIGANDCVAESGATHVYWHKSYEPEGQLVEALVASALREQMGYVECVAQGLAGHLLCKLLQPTLADSTCARTLTGLGASRLSQRMPSFAPQMSRAWW